MSKIQLNELLPDSFKRVTKLCNGSELLFTYELGKYSKLLLGKELVLFDVEIEECIKNSEYFSFVVYNGLDVGFQPEITELAAYNAYKFFTDTVEGVVFKKDDDNEVVYDFHYDEKSNRVMNIDSSKSAAYVSLVAYIIVRNVRDGKKVPRIIIDHEKDFPDRFEFVDLCILIWHGNRLLDGLVEIKYSEQKYPYVNLADRMFDFADNKLKFHPMSLAWIAFVMHYRQHGLMIREYGLREKSNYLSCNFEKGDVVLLYERVNATENDPGDLISCYPTVIRGFDKEHITLEYYPHVRTKLTQLAAKEGFNSIPKENRMALNYLTLKRVEGSRKLEPIREDREMRIEETFRSSMERFHLLDIGVDTHTFIESRFFLKPMEADGSHQYLATEAGVGYYFFNTIDTIFVVFEDNQVDYNRERYKRMYYDDFNREPGYSMKTLYFKEWE
ncbi:hypothetical protein [Cohnella massiliensis]|uniref:hypothetical protein n=1 Tax=Cohnella massiliensis TaxID=1816691 RepID=UPI0009BA62AB|nr:hypothetical protein [Cohnella massiliensis]